MLMRKLTFWILKQFNAGEPSRQEVEWAITKYNHSKNINICMVHYVYGHSYEDIAIKFKSTRERVRQLIRKGVRQSVKSVDIAPNLE